MVKRAIPTYIDYDFHTRGIRDKKTGRMMGRERTKNLGDMTPVLRVKKSVDLNSDGKNEYERGQIIGRGDANRGKTYVRANRRQRAYRRG